MTPDSTPQSISSGPTSTDPVTTVRLRLEALDCRIVSDRGDRFMAQCPAHDDRNPSLSVRTGDEVPGCAVLKCHAGCDLEALLGALDLDFPDLFLGVTRTRTRTRDYGDGGGSPCNTSTNDAGEDDDGGEPELYGLIRAHDRGEIAAEKLAIRDLPERAGADDRAIYEDLRFLMGLRRADGDERPLPYSVRFACERLGWNVGRPMRASRVLRRLERWGIIECPELLAPRSGVQYRTKCYAPCPVAASPPSPPVAANPSDLFRNDTRPSARSMFDLELQRESDRIAAESLCYGGTVEAA